jgi:hypothetical protein
MGLFNSGKNEKVEKVSKYERHYNVPPASSSRRRSSKHRSNQGESAARAMSQPPIMRMAAGGPAAAFYQPGAVFPPAMVGGMAPNMMSQVRYPIPPFDLSKYPPPTVFPPNPFGAGQMAPMNLAPIWNNGIPMMNNRSTFQQPMNDYQQGGWPMVPPSNYGYMPAMQF